MSGERAVAGAGLGPEAAALRDHFLGWQCRLRQFAVRRGEGRPSQGMRPLVLREDGRALALAVTTLIHPRDPAQATDAFRHIVRRTLDPQARYRNALRLLSASHFQRPREFSDVLTALFAAGSPLAAALSSGGRCVLDFREHRQSYRLPCAVVPLAPEAPAWQATYWHNAMFNPDIPGELAVLAFAPDWGAAEADPEPPRLH